MKITAYGGPFPDYNNPLSSPCEPEKPAFYHPDMPKDLFVSHKEVLLCQFRDKVKEVIASGVTPEEKVEKLKGLIFAFFDE